MLRDKYKIILIKLDSFENSKEYQVSLFKLFSVVSLVFMFFSINMYFFSGDILNYFESKEFSKMKNNNLGLSNTIEQQSEQLEYINELVDSLRLQEEKFRKLVKLPSIHSDTKKLGLSKRKHNDDQSFEEYQELLPNNLIQLRDIAYQIDHMQRLLTLELISYNEILNTAEDNISRLQRYPSIHPVDFESCRKTKWIKGKKVTGNCYQSSKFGNRRHPVTLKWHHHDGDDYSANTGTSVFATADGKVEKSQYSGNSGNYILVNHGYGYKTYYGHLSKRIVKKGDKVERGDKIGEIGNTGRSTTAEHLHYEVQFNKQAKNPKDYFFDYSNSWTN